MNTIHELQIPEKQCTCFGRLVHSFHLKRYRDMERLLTSIIHDPDFLSSP